jgi:hypothetical protein
VTTGSALHTGYRVPTECTWVFSGIATHSNLTERYDYYRYSIVTNVTNGARVDRQVMIATKSVYRSQRPCTGILTGVNEASIAIRIVTTVTTPYPDRIAVAKWARPKRPTATSTRTQYGYYHLQEHQIITQLRQPHLHHH